MPKKKRVSKRQPTISVGNVSDVSGNVNIAGGNITTHQTITAFSAENSRQLFDGLYTKIDTRSKTSPAKKKH